MNNEKLILTLIKSDIRNNKLVLGLNELGLLSDGYFTDLGYTIMNLMGFEERDDALYQIYDRFMDDLLDKDITDKEVLNDLALNLYASLLAEKKYRHEGGKE